EIAVVEKENDAQHCRADDQVAPWAEFKQDVAQEDDQEGTENRAFGPANAANGNHGQTKQNSLEIEDRIRHAAVLRRIEATYESECDGGDQEDSDACAPVVDAGGCRKGLVLL